MTLTRSRLLCISLLLAAAPALAQAAEEDLPMSERYHVRLEYLWWSPQLDGQLQKGTAESEGTVLDAKADLGIRETTSNVLQGTLRFGGRWKLRGAWHRLGYDGDVAATKAFDYASVHVSPNDRVQTSLTGHEFTAALECDLMQRSIGYAGLVLGAKYFDVNTTVAAIAADGRTVGRVIAQDGLPVPVAGVAVRLYPHERVSLEGEFSGFPAGSHGHIWEATVAARGHLGDRLALTVGWRKLSLDGHTDRGSLKLGLSKWTLGVEISL
jgi:hypothetical protein